MDVPNKGNVLCFPAENGEVLLQTIGNGASAHLSVRDGASSSSAPVIFITVSLTRLHHHAQSPGQYPQPWENMMLRPYPSEQPPHPKAMDALIMQTPAGLQQHFQHLDWLNSRTAMTAQGIVSLFSPNIEARPGGQMDPVSSPTPIGDLTMPSSPNPIPLETLKTLSVGT
jgi:hypothetical protein